MIYGVFLPFWLIFGFFFPVLYIDWDVVDSSVAFTEEFMVAIYRTLVTLYPSYSGHYETRHGKTNTGNNTKVKVIFYLMRFKHNFFN